MAILVHTISGAPRSWRVLLGLMFKGLDYEIRYLEASKGEHKSPDFLKLNPRGTIPVMEDSDTIIRDSIGCLAWLDVAYPDKPLFGQSAQEAAFIWQTMLECADYLRAAINNLLFPILVQGVSLPPHGDEARLKLEAAAKALHSECQFLTGLLADSPYLAGTAPSAADTVAFPEIRLIQRAIDTKASIMNALGFHSIQDQYPTLAKWVAQISAHNGYDKTTPPHWI